MVAMVITDQNIGYSIRFFALDRRHGISKIRIVQIFNVSERKLMKDRDDKDKYLVLIPEFIPVNILEASKNVLRYKKEEAGDNSQSYDREQARQVVHV